jgi:MFS transporter, PPP family, 3-phenylpropionic acid transporter
MLHSASSHHSYQRYLACEGCAPRKLASSSLLRLRFRVLAGPAVGHIADRQRRHTLTLCACSLVAAVTGLGYVMIQGFAGLLLVALVQAAMLAPIVPLSDALATTAARMSETGQGRRFEYGWLRASGSAAFIVGTMMSGWAASGNGLASIVWFSGTLLGIGGAAALLLPAIPVPRILPDRLPRSITRDWASLLQIPAFRLLLIIFRDSSDGRSATRTDGRLD